MQSRDDSRWSGSSPRMVASVNSRLLGLQPAFRFSERLALLLRHFREPKVERPDRRRNHVGDYGPRDPLVVGRDHVPWSLLRGRRRERVLVSVHVVRPERALREVGRGKLPVLLGTLEALEEPPFLLVLRDVQEE